MRAYDIALLIALFTAVSGVINDIGFMGTYEIPIEHTGYTDSDFGDISGELITPNDNLASEDSKIGSTSLLSAIKKLDDYVFIKTIIMRVFTVNMLPTDPEYTKINNMANIIQIGCGFVYMFAILQLWRKVSTKHME